MEQKLPNCIVIERVIMKSRVQILDEKDKLLLNLLCNNYCGIGVVECDICRQILDEQQDLTIVEVMNH